MIQTTLHSNLNKLIKQHDGLTITKLAQETNIPQPTLHHLIAGNTLKPRTRVLTQLAAFFNVTLAQLCGEEPLANLLPTTIKAHWNIHTVPLIRWQDILNAPFSLADFPELIINHAVGEHSFAVQIDFDTLAPTFPENSILVFDATKPLKDKEYGLVFLADEQKIVLDKIFIDDANAFIRQNLSTNHQQLTQLTTQDKVLGILIEVRLQFG
ncbi:MAG: hypothetical protein CMF38_05575 [Legionellaceae bacterium]|nr:hypothetical protein [Legionellaceae bacterium]HAF87571.1 hypothetical protein [Legionellales bacterium]HCA88888.1 hypothetical protein [Legionellales bacterium]|tara:strand:+ start:866 stop:1498 length:633 start_codon:yes stop_codon:yes gene_type:complete